MQSWDRLYVLSFAAQCGSCAERDQGMLGEQRNSSHSLGSRGCVGRSSKKDLLEGNPDRGIGGGTERE